MSMGTKEQRENGMKRKPNILLITCDQLQAFATGCHGNRDVMTPNIDALAQTGVRFHYGISNAPVCMAARSALLSGQYNRTCTGGVINVGYGQGKIGSYPMPEYPAPGRLHFPDATLPELLRADGYRTAVIGKWHVYTWPDVIGFDHYVIPRTHHVHSTQHYVEDGGEEFVPNGWSVEFETARAIDYLSNQKGEQPFFLYLNYSPPHPPINDCPEKYLRMYDPTSVTLRNNVDEANGFPSEHDLRVYRWDYRYYELQLPYTLKPMDYSVRDIYAAYYGNVTWMDDNLGRVLQALQDSGQRENTIVVFTADHGDNLGSHCRCGKGLPYDEALRVPMIYSHPGTLSPRIDETSVAGLIDVAPTLLSAAGIDTPGHMPGTDVLNGEVAVAMAEITPGDMVARTARFTAHMSMHGSPRRLAFFDNVEDPFQLRNLVNEPVFTEEKERLFALQEDYHGRVPVLPEPDYGFR